jgi:hypothetical protein
MKLLITSTHHKVNLDKYAFFVVDSDTKKIIAKAPCTDLLEQRLDSEYSKYEVAFNPFGITSGEGKIFAASNYVIQAFDENTLEPLEVVSTSGVPNVHQILYHNGYIYRTNTSNNTISRIHLASKEEVHYSFDTMSRVDSYVVPDTHEDVLDTDTMHINHVAVHEEKLYVLAHNRGVKPSDVFVMDLDLTSAKEFVSLDYRNHNLLFDNGKLYSLGTQNGYLVTVDLDTLSVTKNLIVDPERFFLRGILKVNGKIKVVASQRLNVTLERPSRIKFHKEMLATHPQRLKSARLLTINPETLESTSIDLDDFGVVADIQILN